MPSVNKTSLGLNQWENNEYPKRIDFNEDNKTIDREICANKNEIFKLQEDIKNISTDAIVSKFDNSENGMKSTNVQSAIEENKTSILSLQAELKGQVARGITLSNEMLGML